MNFMHTLDLILSYFNTVLNFHLFMYLCETNIHQVSTVVWFDS